MATPIDRLPAVTKHGKWDRARESPVVATGSGSGTNSVQASVEPRVVDRRGSRSAREETLPGKPDVGSRVLEMVGGGIGRTSAVPAPQLILHDLPHVHNGFSVAQSWQDSNDFGDVLLSVVLLVDPDWVDAEQDLEHLGAWLAFLDGSVGTIVS
jgi:hypothetical protein